MQLKAKMLKPLPDLEFVMLVLSRKLVFNYMIQYSIGLVECAFRSEKNERVILFVDLLSRYRFVEEGRCNLDLKEVGVIGSSEVECTCHFN